MTVLTPKVPAGMVDLMKSLSKSVLKEKPENIYEYAAAYFESMLKKRDGSLDKGYGKFRSYQKYCAFVEKMQVRQQKMDKQNDETDSGVGSSNTDDETTKTVCDEAVASSSSAIKMAVNGVAIQASKRNAKPPVQQKKTKNYSVNPKLKAQGSIERDRKGRDDAKNANVALTKKSKAKPRKLSSKKPSENLIVIKEETSADVAEVDEAVKMSSAAARIQRAYRKYQREKEMERVNVVPAVKSNEMNENTAAAIIQRLFKSVLSTKQNLAGKSQKENIILLSDGDTIVLKEGDKIIDLPVVIEEKSSKDPQIELNNENITINSINEVGITNKNDTTNQNNDSNDKNSNSDAIHNQSLEDISITHKTIQNEGIASEFGEQVHPHNHPHIVNNANQSAGELLVEQTNLDYIEEPKANFEVSSPEQQLIPTNEIANEENAVFTDNIENIEITNHKIQPYADELKDEIVDLENALNADNLQKNEKPEHISQPHANTVTQNVTVNTIQTSAESTELKTTGKEQAIQQSDEVGVILGVNIDLEPASANISVTEQPTEYELAETVILGPNDDVDAYVLSSEVTENAEVEDSMEQMANQTKYAINATFEEVGLKLIPSDIIENPLTESYTKNAETGHDVSEKNSKLATSAGQTILEVEDDVGKEQQIAGTRKEAIDVNPIETSTVVSDNVKIEADIINTNDSIIQETVENGEASKVEYNSEENLGTQTSIEPFIEVKTSEQIISEQLSETTDCSNKTVAVEEFKSIDNGETFDSVPIQSDVDRIAPNDLQNISGIVPETVEPLENFEDKTLNGESKLTVVHDIRNESENLNVHDETDLNIRTKRELKFDDNEVKTDDLVDYHEGEAAGELNIKSDNSNTDNIIESTAENSKIESDDINIDNVIVPISHTENINEVITTNSIDTVVPSAPAESPNLQKEDNVNEHSKTEPIETVMLEEFAECLITNNEKDQTADLKNEVVLKIPETTESNIEVIETTELLQPNVSDLKKQSNGIAYVAEVSPTPPEPSLQLQNEEKNVDSSEVLDKTYIIETSQKINEEVYANLQIQMNDLEENASVATTFHDQLELTTPIKTETSPEEDETIANDTGMEAAGDIIRKDPENLMCVEAVAVENEIFKEDPTTSDPIDKQMFERNIEKQKVDVEQVTDEINDKGPKIQIIANEAVESALEKLNEKVPENHVIDVETDKNSLSEGLIPNEPTIIDSLTKEVDEHFTNNIDSTASSHVNFNKAEESVNEILVSPLTATDQDSDISEIGDEMMKSNLYDKLEALEVCNEPLTNPQDTKDADISKATAFGEYVIQTDEKSLINSNQMLILKHDTAAEIIKEEEDSDEWTDTENANESGNTTVRDWFKDKEQNITSTDVQYEQLSSDLSGTEEKNPEQFKESGVDETSRDELDDLSEVENFDLSSCGEDSLEAMYYSLRKNEIMVDKMHRRASEQRGAAESEPDVEDKKEPNEQKIPFPTKITKHLDSAMNEVLGSEKSDKINTSLGSDSDDVVVGNIYDVYPESTTNLSSTDSEVDPIQLKIESPIKINDDLNDDEFMDPMNYAMQQKDELLQRMHGTWFQETINQSNESDQYNEDLDAFPDNPNYASSATNQRKMWTTSVSEADSDYMESAGNRRLTKDDFNISTAFDHLTSTDSDSTIVSAATKIQAGARGFLTRRRLRRSSMGTTLSPDNTHCSFGNAAIDKSLEDLIEQQEIISQDDAAIKIQHSYRRYRNKKLRLLNEQITLDAQSGDSQYDMEQYSIDDGGEEDAQHGIIEIKCEKKIIEQREHDDKQEVRSTSHSPQGLQREEEERYENIIISNEYLEQQQQLDDADSPKIDANDAREPQKYHQLSTATGNTDVLDTAQRRLTLQRGDAVQRHSTPEEIEALLQQQNQPNTPGTNDTAEHEASEINLETGERAAVIRSSSLNTTSK